jgi:2-oxoglutarate dehydrogenase E1 component
MFCPVLVDPEHGRTINDPESISSLVLCTGQVYAALRKHREIEGIRDTAISRIEELHPFPFTEVQRNLNLYRNTKTIVWAQEEPYNGGAWHHVRDRIETILRRSESHRDCRILYAGRPQSAAVAVGIKSLHEAEQKKLLEDVFSTHE